MSATYTTAQRRILNPLSEAMDRMRNLMVPSQIRFCCATMGTPGSPSLFLTFSYAPSAAHQQSQVFCLQKRSWF